MDEIEDINSNFKNNNNKSITSLKDKLRRKFWIDIKNFKWIINIILKWINKIFLKYFF